MSWSFNKSGTAAEVVAALEEQSQSLDGQSKEEFDAAKPHIIAIVNENIGVKTVNLQASGHGYKEEGTYKSKCCNIDLSVGW